MRSAPTPSFDIQRRLGTGGMADVHLAKMALEGQTEWVALKRIRADARYDKELVALFRREAKLCALLQHPNIVPVRTWGVDDQGCYLALRYIDGPSAGRLLKALARAGRQLPLEAALWMLRDVAEALEYAHTFEFPALAIRGVVHRDVSADNLLVSRDGATVLTDFGIAKLIGGTRLTRTGTVKGKYGYLAPELFRGQESTPLVDVFAFCVLGYELLTGVRPFSGATEAEVLHAVLHVQPPSLSSLRPDVPEALAALLRAGLAKEPGDRPGHMGLFRHELERLLASVPTRSAVRDLVQEVGEAEDPVPEATSGEKPVITVTHAAAEPPRGRRKRTLAVGFAVVAISVAGIAAYARRTPAEDPLPPPPAVAPQSPPLAATRANEPVPAPPVESRQSGAPVTAPVQDKPSAKAAPVTRTRPSPKRTQDAAAAPTGRAKKDARSSGPGTLRILVHPWAQVFVDGKLVGTTPLPVLSLPPGRHSLILVNEALDVREVHHVDVRAGQQKEVKYTLRRR